MKRPIVVGAGIAGASICYALAKKNIPSLLLDSFETPASRASGNPLGLVYPFLTKYPTEISKFSLVAFQHFLEHWDLGNLSDKIPSKEGIRFLLTDASEKLRYRTAIQSHQLKNDIVYEEVDPNTGHPSLVFPRGKTISPVDFISYLLSNSLIQFAGGHRVLDWKPLGKDLLEVVTEKGKIETDFLFLCQGAEEIPNKDLTWLSFRPVRGQILNLGNRGPDIDNSLLYGDYLSVKVNGSQVLGASYDEYKLDSQIREEENHKLWLGLRSILTNIQEELPKGVEARVSFRSQTPDRSLSFGHLLFPPKTLPSYQVWKWKNAKNKPSAENLGFYREENIGILNGLGSRGLTHALYAAHSLVLHVLEKEYFKGSFLGFRPERFWIRNWKQQSQDS